MTYEVFDPTNGRPIIRVRQRWLARFLARRGLGLDYARTGEGW